MDGTVDQDRVERERRVMLEGFPTRDSRVTAAAWERDGVADFPAEIAVLAYAYAVLGDPKAEPLIAQLAPFQATEAAAIKGILLWQQGKFDKSADALVTAFERLHDDPWPVVDIVHGALEVAALVAHQDRRQAGRLFAAIREPFAVGCAEDRRGGIVCMIASMCDVQAAAEQINAFEPNVPWTKAFLGLRRRVYEATGHPLAAQAARDLADYESAEIAPSAPKGD